ncbi:MAG TPA: class I SAM-dependent methyltransferase [Pyrinomonadaceae bacterium]|nr:class I SAM-dependent methyltransferase [Pyrinomonadaceae bacterium]
MEVAAVLREVRAARARLAQEGPTVTRPFEGDFQRVSLPVRECDVLRDVLLAEGACAVIEVGLAYGSSALAIGEAVLSTCGRRARHVLIDPFQVSEYSNAGWELLRSAGLEATSRLLVEASSLALPRLLGEGFVADAAFVDGSHRFHEVFVDLYFLRKIVRPGGLVVLDDVGWPSVGSALAYFDVNLGWRPVDMGNRLTGRRLPDELSEPAFTDFKPFLPLA